MFHKWTYKSGTTLRNRMDTLLWLEQWTATKVTEQVAIDTFLRSLPPEEHKAVSMQSPNTFKEMAQVLSGHPGNWQRGVERDLSQPLLGWLTLTPVAAPTIPHHQTNPCQPNQSSLHANRPWLAGSVVHTCCQPKVLTFTIKLDSMHIPGLLGSGSRVTLAR